MTPEARGPGTDASLLRRIEKLERINAALMGQVERSMDQRGSAYSLFQTAIMLEGRVRTRTEELTGLMHRLERANAALECAKDEAETANRSKTRFLAAASHDLLQPVNAARLSLSALGDLALPPEARAVVGQVERGLQTIEALIRTLLDISKLDAGVVQPEIGPMFMPDLLAPLAAGFRPFAERKGLRLSVRCPNVTVATDALLLRRILQNLVSNAVRYTNEGGVLIAARRRGEGVHIAVVDTGCGIAAEEQSLVFDEFFRGRAPACMEEEPGLGLGLSIVHRMAQALDHPLRLDSRLGHGTTVSLIVPLSPAAAASQRCGSVTTGLCGARILVVEDDASSAQALGHLLRSWDAQVDAHRDLASVQAAIEQGADLPEILILDDHRDGGACGLTIAGYLRGLRAGPLSVVVTAADPDAAIERRVAEIGAELVFKPIKPAELRALLTSMLARVGVQRVT